MDRAPMTPHSNFRDPKYNREKENEKNRKDPTLSMRPSMPAKGKYFLIVKSKLFRSGKIR